MPSDFYSSFGPWLLHGFARTESYSISLNEDSSLELELSSTKCNEEKELSFPSIRPYVRNFNKPFIFRAFHVKKVSIQGLKDKNLSYLYKSLNRPLPTRREGRP